MTSDRVNLNVEKVVRISVRRFIFFMKSIAENDLWDEAEFHLEDLGCTELIVSSEPIAAVQVFLKHKAANGEQLSPRGRRVAACECGGGGGGGGDGGSGDGGSDDQPAQE